MNMIGMLCHVCNDMLFYAWHHGGGYHFPFSKIVLLNRFNW